MPPPPLPDANRTSGNGPAPAGTRSPMGAYTPSTISTYMSCTGTSEPRTGSTMATCSGSEACNCLVTGVCIGLLGAGNADLLHQPAPALDLGGGEALQFVGRRRIDGDETHPGQLPL